MSDCAAPELLVITRNLPPLRGGMERLNAEMIRALQRTYNVSVCGPRGCREEMSLDPARIREAPHRPLPAFLASILLGMIVLACRHRPEVVLAGSGLTAPIAWLAARCTGARFVVYVHGLDIVAPSRLYQHLWLPFMRRADLVLANSRNTKRLAIARGIPAGKVGILHPGVSIGSLDEVARTRFRDKLGLGDRPLLLSVGRLTPRKGLREFVSEALPAVLKRSPAAILLIIGDDATDAVRATSGSERSRIEQAAEEAGVGAAVRFLPPCDDDALAQAYIAADVYIFPVRDIPGDVEGFGMVALEAAAHGLPTVAFDVGGVGDAVSDGVSGRLVTAGDYRQFADSVTKVLEESRAGVFREKAREFARGFCWSQFGESLRKALAS